MKKWIPYVFASLFALLLLLPAVFMERGVNVVSDLDNRTLTEAPVFGESGFQSGTEKYLRDRIGGRSFMIRFYTQLHDIIFGQMVHPTYTYGKDGYVFFKMHNNVEFGDYHRHFAQMCAQMQEYCESRGAHFYLLFNPEKISVYRRYLPAGVNYNDEWVDEFFTELDRLGVTYVSNSEYLRELSYTEQVFNHQYNAGHWNDLGAFYGMNHLFARMHEDFPAVRELSLDDFDVSTRLQTSLQVSEFPIHEEEPALTAHAAYTDLTETIRSEVRVHPDYRHLHYYLNDAPDASSLPRVLIFQGSYLNSWTQFMFQNASAELGVHNYMNVFDLPYYFQIMDPDAVVFEVAEYVFQEIRFPDSGMTSLDFPDALLPADENPDVDDVLSSLPLLDLPMEAVVFPGIGLDTVRVSSVFGMHHSWIVTRDRILDLTDSGNGCFEAAVLAGSLTEQPDAVLVVEDEAGNRFRVTSGLRYARELSVDYTLTNGAAYVGDGAFAFDTNVPGNAFSYVGLQLYDPVSQTYETIARGSETGTVVSGYYCHAGPAFDCVVHLRANSNLVDERATCQIHLEPNQGFYYRYIVDEFDSSHASVSDFTILY